MPKMISQRIASRKTSQLRSDETNTGESLQWKKSALRFADSACESRLDYKKRHEDDYDLVCGTAIYFEDEAIETKGSHSVLSDMATELIRRSSGSSQILNVNLSNLLLLLVLKAIVYGAGYIGNHTFKSRGEPPDDKILSEGEAALALGYLIGDTCLYRAACEVPQTAKEYLGAADMVFQTMKLMPSAIDLIDERLVEDGWNSSCRKNNADSDTNACWWLFSASNSLMIKILLQVVAGW